jgi:hypothetical protein
MHCEAKAVASTARQCTLEISVKILVVGAGAIGGYYGARLLERARM